MQVSSTSGYDSLRCSKYQPPGGAGLRRAQSPGRVGLFLQQPRRRARETSIAGRQPRLRERMAGEDGVPDGREARLHAQRAACPVEQQTVEGRERLAHQRVVLAVAETGEGERGVRHRGEDRGQPVRALEARDHPGGRAGDGALAQHGGAGQALADLERAVDGGEERPPGGARRGRADRCRERRETARGRRARRGARRTGFFAHRIDSGTKIVRDQLDMS